MNIINTYIDTHELDFSFRTALCYIMQVWENTENISTDTNEELLDSSFRDTLFFNKAKEVEYVFSIEEIKEMIDEAYAMEINEQWQEDMRFIDLKNWSWIDTKTNIEYETWSLHIDNKELILPELIWLVRCIESITGVFTKKELALVLMSLNYHLNDDKTEIYDFTITKKNFSVLNLTKRQRKSFWEISLVVTFFIVIVREIL